MTDSRAERWKWRLEAAERRTEKYRAEAHLLTEKRDAAVARVRALTDALEEALRMVEAAADVETVLNGGRTLYPEATGVTRFLTRCRAVLADGCALESVENEKENR